MSERLHTNRLTTTAIACILVAACQAQSASKAGDRKAATKPSTATEGQPAKTTTIGCMILSSPSWPTRNQATDGSFAGPDGKPDLTATCLATLALLGDGSTMRAGPQRKVIKNAVRWLARQQRPDGTFQDADENSTLQHGLATYTIVESAGLSDYRLCWKHADPALAALLRMRKDDGGWSCDPTQANSSSEATAWGALACLSARYFGHAPADLSPDDLVAWFHKRPATTAKHAAMELFCRAMADKKPADQGKGEPSNPTLAAHPLAVRVLAEASVEQPHECFWASNALFAVGGDTWKAWQQKLNTLTTTRVKDFESEHVGTWEPYKGLSRMETTTLRVMALQTFYRYSRLHR